MIRKSGLALAGILAAFTLMVPTSEAEACHRCGWGGCGSRCGGYSSGCGYRYGGCYSGCGSSCGGCNSGCVTPYYTSYAPSCGGCYSSCGSSCGTSCGTSCGSTCGSTCGTCSSGYGYPTYGASRYYSYSYAAPNGNRYPVNGIAPGQSLANRPQAMPTPVPMTRASNPVVVQPVNVESRRPSLFGVFTR